MLMNVTMYQLLPYNQTLRIQIAVTSFSVIKQLIIFIYAICFSVIKSCTYWNCSTLQALYEHASMFFDIFVVDNVSLNMPSMINIYDASVEVQYIQKTCGSFTKAYDDNKALLIDCIKNTGKTNVKPTGFLFYYDSHLLSCNYLLSNNSL